MPKNNGITRINGKPFTVLENLNVLGEFRTNGTLLGEALLDSSSTAAEQSPSSTDTPLQIEFGAAQENDYVSLSEDGEVTIKVAGYYQLNINVTFGRDTNPGDAILFGRLLVNGSQTDNSSSIAAILPNERFIIPKQVTVTSYFPENSVITFEIARDSGGNNNGGLFRRQTTTLDWNDAPTASIEIYNVE